MKPEIGLLDKNRDAVVKILNTTLSDEMVLLVKTRNYHWNVTGPQFNDLHKFLDAQYEELNEIVDDVAESTQRLLQVLFERKPGMVRADGDAHNAILQYAFSSGRQL